MGGAFDIDGGQGMRKRISQRKPSASKKMARKRDLDRSDLVLLLPKLRTKSCSSSSLPPPPRDLLSAASHRFIAILIISSSSLQSLRGK